MTWDLGSGLEGRGVIVTGAASGIGRATAQAMAAAGARVAALDRDASGLQATVAGLDGDGHLALPFDLADAGAIEPLVRSAADALGDLWALAHVAAVLRRQRRRRGHRGRFRPADDRQPQGDVLPRPRRRRLLVERGGGGRIVNFTSAAFLTGALSGSDAYVATKGGVVTMTRSFAKQYGRHGITVNVVSPGQIDTPMQHVDNPPEFVEAAIQACPMRRIGQPEEVAAAVVFLASRHASFVNGATLTVSGGSVMH